MNHIKEVHVTQFSDHKAIVAVLIAAHRAGQPVALKGLTRLTDVLLIAQAISDETGWVVGAIKDKEGLTHFTIIDCEDFTTIDSEEPQP